MCCPAPNRKPWFWSLWVNVSEVLQMCNLSYSKSAKLLRCISFIVTKSAIANLVTVFQWFNGRPGQMHKTHDMFYSKVLLAVNYQYLDYLEAKGGLQHPKTQISKFTQQSMPMPPRTCQICQCQCHVVQSFNNKLWLWQTLAVIRSCRRRDLETQTEPSCAIPVSKSQRPG